MSYLTNHPELQYNLNNKNYSLKDIFRRVAFSTNSLNNNKIFADYYVIDGETFEQIAETIYGNRDFFWILVLANNIVSNLELPKTEQEVQTSIDTKYSGSAIYFSEYLNGLKAGDILVKVALNDAIKSESSTISDVDTSKYALVKGYDPIFRIVWIDGDIDTFTTGDIIGFYSVDSSNNWQEFNFNVKLSSSGNIIQRSFAQPEKIEYYKNSPVQFNDANGNYSSPYYNGEIEIPSNAIGTYPTDLNDIESITKTDLFAYMNAKKTSFSSITTLNRKIIDDNQKFRIIKVLKPFYLNRVLESLNELTTSNVSKSITIDVENNTYGPN